MRCNVREFSRRRDRTTTNCIRPALSSISGLALDEEHGTVGAVIVKSLLGERQTVFTDALVRRLANDRAKVLRREVPLRERWLPVVTSQVVKVSKGPNVA
jgi:hypothetical protein